MYIEFVRNLLLQTEQRAKEDEKIRGREGRQRPEGGQEEKKGGKEKVIHTHKKMTEEKDDEEVWGRMGRK